MQSEIDVARPSLRTILRVLVVDDTSTSRGLISQALDALGVRHVATVPTAEQALTALKSTPAHLVISDYYMPGTDGLALLRTLRSDPATANIGFLLVTGRASDELLTHGKLLKMNNFLEKPFTTDGMKAAIEAIFGHL